MINFNVQDLDNTWVVCKRVKGQFFFVYYSNHVTTTDPRDANKYNNKTDAETIAAQWKAKQKCKFRVEPLSKFMLNDFSLSYDRYRSETKDRVMVSSRPITVRMVTEKKREFNLQISDTIKNGVITSIEKDIEDQKSFISKKDTALEEANKLYAERLVQAAKELETSKLRIAEDVQRANLKLEEFNNLKKEVTEFDFNASIEKYKTKTDKNMQVLYGKKKSDEELTTQDSGKMMILPLRSF